MVTKFNSREELKQLIVGFVIAGSTLTEFGITFRTRLQNLNELIPSSSDERTNCILLA